MRFRYLEKSKINSLPKKINSLPETAGVYAFKNGRNFLYIGKAINIRNRIKNHFQQPTNKNKVFLEKIKKIGYIKTESEIEALILESELIKKYRSKFNTLWKDSKNYFYAVIEPTGRVYLTHQLQNKIKIDFIGPFVDGKAIKQVLKILRKIFPYYTSKKHPQKKCIWCHLGLCPGPNPNKEKLKKDLKNLKKVLEGKKNSVLSSLKKEMSKVSKIQDYEKAIELRNKIIALEKVLANSKIISKPVPKTKYKKIEGYDISNIQGKFAVGSMVVFINGQPEKSLYRKFKIKYANSVTNTHIRIEKPNDTAMIKEVLKRRLKHKEWPLPDLMLIDGGKGQLNAAISVVEKVNIAALAKKENKLFLKNKKDPLLLKNLSQDFANLILHVRDEAHRFAITYHKKLREKSLLN